MLKVMFLVTSSVVVLSGSAFAATLAVGTCKPTAPSFTTIQAAVNAAPSGAIIDVCPGTYPEQVTITKNLKLQGIATGQSNAAIIVPPATGLVNNTASLVDGSPIAAQVLVSGTPLVTIANITVDGSNNLGATCSFDPIGIYYQNASGTINETAVQNQALTANLNGCQGGLGIYVESGGSGTSTVSITNNQVKNFQKNGITANEIGTTVTVTGNTVIGQGPTTGAAENSIQLGFGAVGTVSANIVGDDVWAPDVFGDTGDAAAGILVYGSAGVKISGNYVSNTQYGITVDSDVADSLPADGSVISGNHVQATHLYDAIDLCSSSNVVTKNTVFGSDESAIHVDDTCTGTSTGNSVANNTINSACAGILIGPSGSGSTSPNTYYNVTTEILSGSDVCPLVAPATSFSTAATRHGKNQSAPRVQPARL